MPPCILYSNRAWLIILGDPNWIRAIIPQFLINPPPNNQPSNNPATINGLPPRPLTTNNRPPFPAIFASLPQELREMVMDFLTYTDIIKMRQAFRLPVGKPYFRSRAQKELFVELNQFGEDELDWESFVLWSEKECGRPNSSRSNYVFGRMKTMPFIRQVLDNFRDRIPR